MREPQRAPALRAVTHRSARPVNEAGACLRRLRRPKTSRPPRTRRRQVLPARRVHLSHRLRPSHFGVSPVASLAVPSSRVPSRVISYLTARAAMLPVTCRMQVTT